MKGRGRGEKNPRVRSDQREAAREREALERAWADRLEDSPHFAAAVTFVPNREEPRHRWLPYRQGFSRGLVESFLQRARPRSGPILDPFSGSGTVPLAVAQKGFLGVGVEAIPAVAFLARAKSMVGEPPPLPPLPEEGGPEDLATCLEHPLHRAALLVAAGRFGSARSSREREGGLGASRLQECFRMVAQDVMRPCPGRTEIVGGDARRLPLATGSIEGILTSPPYLARYDYVRMHERMGSLYRLWHPGSPDRRGLGGAQVHAHRKSGGRTWESEFPPAADEVSSRLAERGEGRLAGIVRSYFEDLSEALSEMARVLVPGAPAWVVIGGSHLERVYVPTDLILAEIGRDRGLRPERLLVARRLSDQARRLGSIRDLATRETIVVFRRE